MIDAQKLADTAVLAAMLLLSASAFGPVFDGAPGYLPAGVGALLGVGLGLAGAWRGLSVASLALGVILSYLVFGGMLALPKTTVGGVLPTPETIHRLTVLTVRAWRDLLTVTPPASEFTGPAVVPLLAGLLCGVLAISLGLRTAKPLTAWLPLLAFLVVGILWGVKDAPLAPVVGLVLALTGMAWSAWRRSRSERDAAEGILLGGSLESSRLGRVWKGAAVLGAAGIVALAAGTSLAAQQPRQVLRDDVQPPFDPRSYASPLTMYRSLETDLKETQLFTVSGLPADGRLRLATLDAYDGIVYRAEGSSADYAAVGGKIGTGAVPADATRLRVAVDNYSGVWLPLIGVPRRIDFGGSGASVEDRGVYLNAATGTMLATTGIGKGEVINLDVIVPPVVDRAALADDHPSADTLPANTRVPEIIQQRAVAIVSQASGGGLGQRLLALERALKRGAYSNGTADHSRAGHTAERIQYMLEQPQMVGDDEQYAVTMALMARSLGASARVVLGFYPEKAPAAEEVTLFGKDAHVWTEIKFDKSGWVAFDPTPPRENTPQIKTPRPEPKPIPQVFPPPDPPKHDLADRALLNGDDKDKKDRDESSSIWGTVLIVASIAAAAALAVFSPFGLVLMAKQRRRRRRRFAARSVDRMSGAWDEVVDAAADARVLVPVMVTRQECARLLEADFPDVALSPIAVSADAGVFAAGEPSSEDVDRIWAEVDQALAGVRSGQRRWERLRARVSLRSLLFRHGDREQQ